METIKDNFEIIKVDKVISDSMLFRLKTAKSIELIKNINNSTFGFPIVTTDQMETAIIIFNSVHNSNKFLFELNETEIFDLLKLINYLKKVF